MKHVIQIFRQWKSNGSVITLLALLLSACSPQFLIGDAVSLVATDKTIGDHTLSFVSGKDCSSVRREIGLTYCKEDDPQRTQPDAPLHCYKELGKVTCYKDADLSSIRPTVEQKVQPPRQWDRSALNKWTSVEINRIAKNRPE